MTALAADLRIDASAAIRILLVDDSRALRAGCENMLQADGFSVTSCARSDEALELLRRSRFDIVVADLAATPVPGLDVLRAALAVRPETVVVMMAGNPSVESSIEAMRLGAWDYLPKPFAATHLQLVIGRAAHVVNARRDGDRTRASQLASHGNSDRMTLIGVSPAFRDALAIARKVATTNASVMLVGESGTGKEVIAHFLHAHGRRANEALVPLNCAAMPEQLLESEMFGHRKGAFTGADRDKVGLLEAADRGTLFLDEFTEMPVALQAKLLRVIQDGVVRRVGSSQQDAVVDVRFVTATNRDPREAVKSGRLREDFYYRLNVVQITLPPLRERAEDIPILANHFLRHFWARHHPAHDPLPHFGPAAMAFLESRPWRGNVRELQNVVEHVAVFATPDRELTVADLPREQDEGHSLDTGEALAASPRLSLDTDYHAAKEQTLARFEEAYVTRLVARAQGNVARAARLASVDRTTLYRLMQRQGLQQPAEQVAVA